MHTQRNNQPRKLLLASGIAMAISTMGNTYAMDKMPKDVTEAEQADEMSMDGDAQAESITSSSAPRDTVQAESRSELPVADQISNARLESQISTTYALSPYLRAYDIKVSVKDGKATLSGIVDDEVNKELASEIAKGVPGIESVDNGIEVQADHTAARESSSERTFGQVVEDLYITAAVKFKLAWSKQAEAMATDVETEAGKVILSGTVDSEEDKEHADRLALNTRGVESVDNQLVIDSSRTNEEQSPDISADDDSDQPIADTWITTKIKSTYMFSDVDSSHISVNTVNGVVTLSGNVDSGAEQALAIELAENIRGVHSVDSSGLQVGNPVATR